MNTAPPSIPAGFMQKLNKFDKDLDLEWLGDHWCIIDTSKKLATYPRNCGGLVAYTTYRHVYDRILHLKPDQLLDSGVIRELQYRDTYRFGDKKYFKKHLEKLVEKEEQSKLNSENDMNEATLSDLKTIKNFSVVMPGKKQ